MNCRDQNYWCLCKILEEVLTYIFRKFSGFTADSGLCAYGEEFLKSEDNLISPHFVIPLVRFNTIGYIKILQHQITSVTHGRLLLLSVCTIPYSSYKPKMDGKSIHDNLIFKLLIPSSPNINQKAYYAMRHNWKGLRELYKNVSTLKAAVVYAVANVLRTYLIITQFWQPVKVVFATDRGFSDWCHAVYMRPFVWEVNI